MGKQNLEAQLTSLQLKRVRMYASGMTYSQIAAHEDRNLGGISWCFIRARRNAGVATTEELCHHLGMECIGHKPTLNGGL